MKKLSPLHIIITLLAINLLLIFSCENKSPELPVLSSSSVLSTNWKMQKIDKLKGIGGEQISQNNFQSNGWHDAIVPGTVMGSLVSTGVIEDPYFGINMKKVDREQFKQPWWYRTVFTLKNEDLKKNVSLRFNGINYRADLWINGKKVANNDEFAGAFKIFTFQINEYITEGENTIALKIGSPVDGEYSIGFVDWNPIPPDRNMGIFREVILEINEGIKIRSPFIYSTVNKETLDEATLFIQTELENNSNKTIEGILRVNYEIGIVEQKVSLKAGQKMSCIFSPKDFKQLAVKNVNLWWPNGMGNPDLYDFKVEFISDNKILDKTEGHYGIREITSSLDENKNRIFKVNGKFVLIKGGGWVDDLLLQDTKKTIEAQLKYVKHMNMNSIRLEGFWGKDHTLYDLCDEYGILIMAGWSCQWEWDEYLLKPTHEKYGGATNEEDINLLADSWKDQMLWLRNHPSIYVWMLGSDKLPAPDLERKYIELFKKYDPSRSYVTSAGGAGTEDNNIVTEVPLVSEISGPTGMKMLGPYAYTPPVYWFTDTQLGGGYGFNTETSPGPNVPPLASLKKMIPEENLWPIDTEYWEYHCGRNAFSSLDRYRKAMDMRYGESSSVKEFAYKSQLLNYELMRPMFEAFIAHKPTSTGLIQWMLNSAWPEMYWQLYDSYLQPNGAFYAVKKACTPLHAIYRYGFDDIYIANEDLFNANNITVQIRVFDIYSKEIFMHKWNGNIKTNLSKYIYKLPEIENLTDVWFLDLRVYDENGKEVDNSIYWLSRKKDVLDYEAAKKLDWPFYTPTKEYADFSDLEKLPKVNLIYDYKFSKDEVNGMVTLNVKNPSKSIAFFIFFDLVNPKTGEPILPIYWDDNYVSLLPGEERSYEVNYDLSDFKGEKPLLKVKAWNVDEVTLNN